MLGRSWFRIALRLRNRAIATAESPRRVRADERPPAQVARTAQVISQYDLPPGPSPRRATRQRPCGFWAEPPSVAALLLPPKKRKRFRHPCPCCPSLASDASQML